MTHNITCTSYVIGTLNCSKGDRKPWCAKRKGLPSPANRVFYECGSMPPSNKSCRRRTTD